MKSMLKIILLFALLFSLIVIVYSESVVDVALFQWSIELPIAAVICFTLSMGISMGIVLSSLEG